MGVNAKRRDQLKCAQCKGAPSQHNIRDASIAVAVFPDDILSPINYYPQHSFKLSLAVAGS